MMLCTNCELKRQLEGTRSALHEVVSDNNLNLLDEKVLSLSQILDEMIVQCLNCKNRFELQILNNVDDIFGTHSAFYYYGFDHLNVNMMHYIKKGLSNNELVYVSMEHQLFDRLTDLLKDEGLQIDSVRFKSVKEYISSHKSGGLDNLRKTVINHTNTALENGYKGIRIIGQPTFAMQETSREDFLNWEDDLSQAFINTSASIL